MIEFRKSIIFSALVLCTSILTACGGGDKSSVSTARFDSAVELPAASRSLGKDASAPLLYAIQTRGFETEYNKENIYALHQNAWERWDLGDYIYDGAYSETQSCADIAKYQGESSGSGKVTIINALQENYVGYVEHRYDNCVIGDRIYTGTRRIKVLEEPRDHPSGRPAAKFRWEYENYYWGRDGLNYFLDGTIGFEELVDDATYSYSYQSTSNYTFSHRNGYRIRMRDLVSQCNDSRNEFYDNDYSWRCEIRSGQVALHGLGEYSVKTLRPVHQSVWLWGAKLQVSDNESNHLVFWGEDGQKRVTLVDVESKEKTYAVEYNTTSMTSMQQSHVQPISPALEVVDTRFKRWDQEFFTSDTDEFVYFNPSDARYVDAFHYDAGQVTKERRIDLIEPAYSVNVFFEGDTIVSGHDGSTRSIFLKDPELKSSKRAIGLGKITEIHGDRAVTYQVPGSYERERISYQWDYANQAITSTRNLGSSQDSFAYKNGQFAVGDWNSVEFRTDQFNDYNSKYLNLGENYGYLKFFDNDLAINGSGALVKCVSRCNDSAVYWKSVNEAIANQYPSYGSQIVVAAATDTEGFYTAPSVLVFATATKSEWVPLDDQRNPESADHLWAVDLNDMRRVVKLDLPFNDFSVPKVGLKVRELFNRKGSNELVGIGSWDLASGRENTVMFSIDLDEIIFD